MKYIDAIREGTEELAKNRNTIFLGYNVAYGNKGGGIFKNIPQEQLYETPLAENLMMSLGIGLALEGYFPIVYFERFDFMLNAMDSLVNHLDKTCIISNGEYDPKVYIRVAVGRRDNPFFSGVTHTQDLTEAVDNMVGFPVYKFTEERSASYIKDTISKNYNRTFMTVEYMDFYDKILKNN